MHTYFSHVIPNYSKNQDGAKALLKWVHTKANYEPWFVSQKGFATPPTHEWEKHKLWEEDKVMAPFKIAGLLGQTPGYPLPSSGKKAAEVLTKYIITDMYAKAIQGAPAEDSVKWAEVELKKVYS
jgi:multiple sugar transport system substrate-binding protein